MAVSVWPQFGFPGIDIHLSIYVPAIIGRAGLTGGFIVVGRLESVKKIRESPRVGDGDFIPRLSWQMVVGLALEKITRSTSACAFVLTLVNG